MCTLSRCASSAKESRHSSFCTAPSEENVGYLRIPSSVQRVQDVPTEPLLCSDCEQRFSRWERTFSLDAFRRIQGNNFDFFEYDRQRLKFAVSLSWRTLIIDRFKLMEACVRPTD